MAKLLLLDGNSLAYRAFFALPTDMATASGQVTNAVFGFTSMLVNLLKDHQPDGIAVAFDLPTPTFRHEMIPDYKAGRSEAPDILRQQMGLVRQVVEALKIPIVEVPTFEADDVIATLATQARDRGDDVIIVSGDRDTYQLVEDPHVTVLYNKRGVSDYAHYNEAGIQERTGVHPLKYPEYAALRGDPSDNLPGVPGVGEKTAAKLLNDYGDLDGVFANLDKLTPKLRANLEASEAQVRSNATATPLVRDVPLECDLDDLKMGGWDTEEVRNLFNFLEFRTLWDRLLEATSQAPVADAPAEGATFEVSVEAATAESLLAVCQADQAVAVEASWQGEPGRSALQGLAFATSAEQAQWLPVEAFEDDKVHAALCRLFGHVSVHAHKAKELMRGLAVLGVDVTSLGIDTAVAAYLIDPAVDQYLLEDLCIRYAGIDVRAPDAPPPGQLDLEGTATDASEETARRASAVLQLVEPLAAALDARGLRDLYDSIERPLVRVLARMEAVGVRVDGEYLAGLIKSLTDEVRQLEGEIQEQAGHPFTVNSTKQLRTVLYDELGLAPQKKTKTGYSTDAQSLEKLKGQHPIIDKLLRYREVEKLRSTYGEGLVSEIGPDGRIHATFQQTVARTGRLSSDRPNLHNIPIRTEEGRQFRRAFLPEEGWDLLIADYNQIELRVIAHLAEDPGLIEAFTSGQDIHAATASRIFEVDHDSITNAQRSKAKMVSYGLAYGMESYGLAQRLNIAVDEAAEILRAYFAAFPNVKSYMDRTVEEARQRGYTETLFGRRRQIPELSSSNFRIRQAGERQAMNAGIQGLAADIFKVALVRLDAALSEEGLDSRLILQVHDEVILEVPPDEHDRAAALTLEAMRGAADLGVPLEVNLAWGQNWAEAKG
ncbi:MAG TPA: DNA polymerase I [Acidimicrobiales bacterium]|jgi:DNA polymerase-1|nr:DNA polymerase I [Acidimicrobiales bacterium]